jgi:hypothetical protein
VVIGPRRRRFCSDACCKAGRRAERVYEPDEYAKAVVRMLVALAVKFANQDAAVLGALWDVRQVADEVTAAAIDALRRRGYSWSDLAAWAGPGGMTKQGLAGWRDRHEPGSAVSILLTGNVPAGQGPAAVGVSKMLTLESAPEPGP